MFFFSLGIALMGEAKSNAWRSSKGELECLGYIGDSTTQLCGDYFIRPLYIRIPSLSNQVFMESKTFFFVARMFLVFFPFLPGSWVEEHWCSALGPELRIWWIGQHVLTRQSVRSAVSALWLPSKRLPPENNLLRFVHIYMGLTIRNCNDSNIVTTFSVLYNRKPILGPKVQNVPRWSWSYLGLSFKQSWNAAVREKEDLHARHMSH